MRQCHSCGGEIEDGLRVGRRDTCLCCGAELHCCLNCRFYAPGYQNDCLETQAERVVEKARSNFCDYFSFRVAAVGAGRSSLPSRPSRPSRARSELETLFRKKQ